MAAASAGEANLAELTKRFSVVYTGAITDVLDELGLRHQTLPPALAPLRPGMRFAGPAFPVEGRPNPGADYDRSVRKILTMLGEVPPGHALVSQPNDDSSAYLGELSVTSLKARGCVGAVIDGGCRDVEYTLREDFPVFSRYTTPQDCVPRWDLLAWNTTIVIGGVNVAPGDYVIADLDGVVVIPSDIRDEVLTRSEELVGTESEIRTAIRNGMLPLEAYERFGSF